MTKQTLLLVVLSIIFMGSIVGAYYVFKNTKSDNIDDSIKYSPASTAEEKLSNPQEEQVKSGSQLQVQGATTELPQNQNSIPTPANFSVYEKFINDETASYVDIVVGRGSEVEVGDRVAMLYQGWLTNGELFDQSRTNEQGQIETFVLEIGAGQVIPGWEQTILGMKEAGKRRLIIPPVAGYGASGQGPIPPNAMLIFDVELIEIQKKDLNPPGAILP